MYFLLSLRYHIPRFFLKTGENLLVLMEEIGGDPLQITVNTMSVTRIYGSVSEFSTPSLLSRDNHPAVHLRCQKGKHITDVEFASYGNPVEDCRGSGRSCQGSCHAEMSEFIVKNVKFCCFRRYIHCINVVLACCHKAQMPNKRITCFVLSGLPRQKEVRRSSTGSQVWR